MLDYLNGGIKKEKVNHKKTPTTAWLTDYDDKKLQLHVKWGPLSSGGHSIKITGYKVVDNTLLVSVIRQYPPVKAVVITVISYPQDTVLINKEQADISLRVVVKD